MKLKFQQSGVKRRLAVSMTPLIDVVFLLMVFFLMTINFEKPELVLENRLPQLGVEASEDPSKDWETVELHIEMARQGGQLRLFLEERALDSYAELLDYLALLPDDILVVIDAADDVPYKHVIGVYNTCLQASKQEIVFSVTG
ncbi:MAG: biopolymer transporter ExbD [Immundisolibacteraceae bacterium]|nr:biopolymer transporter ExbD [Immundisolibacteraceae bacterium]